MSAEPTAITQFSLQDLPEQDRFPVWKESISVIFDVDWADSHLPNGFDARLVSAHLGHLLLVETTSAGQAFNRPENRIRQDGIDHCLIQIYLEGSTRGIWGDKTHSVARPGDVLFLDTAQTVRSETSDFRNLTLLVPRTLLVPHLGTPESFHGCILPRDSAPGRLLGEHLRLLWELVKTTPAMEAQIIGLGLLDLIGRYFGGVYPKGNHEDSPRMNLAVREMIRIHIEQVLELPVLSADYLSGRFGLSRSSLYNLFKPLGGISGYIQNRRLLRAHVCLLSTEPQARNITDMALRMGFSDLSHFSRAFRKKFGYSPSEVHMLSLIHI